MRHRNDFDYDYIIIGSGFGGYPNLLVADGSAVPVNLGVNPSLTIAAISEHIMSRIPGKIRRDHEYIPRKMIKNKESRLFFQKPDQLSR